MWQSTQAHEPRLVGGRREDMLKATHAQCDITGGGPHSTLPHFYNTRRARAYNDLLGYCL